MLKKNVGFIGLGTMGMPMAVNLLKAGYSLQVYNRTAEKAEALTAHGAEVASSAVELAREAEIIFTNVSNDEALLEVFYGDQGILEGLQPGTIFIDCSTVSPDTSRKIHDELEARYAYFLDAPVTGSKPAAEDGTLVFMVGGNEEIFQEHKELFDVLGKKALYLGQSGSGSYAKLAHNAIVGINAIGLMEGFTIAAKAGLSADTFLEIVTSGGANSRQAELKGHKIISRDFSNQFSTALMLKDMLLAQKLTAGFQLPAPLLNAAASIYQMGLSKGLGDDDLSSVVLCYEEWAQLQIGSPRSTAGHSQSADNGDASGSSDSLSAFGSPVSSPELGTFGSAADSGLPDSSVDSADTGTLSPFGDSGAATGDSGAPGVADAADTAGTASERRRANRISLGIKLHLSVHQWQQEGSFSGQVIEGTLHDLSEYGLLIGCTAPLAHDMFVVIHFPQDAALPPITGKIIRIEARPNEFRYGCTLSGLPPYTRIKLEQYIRRHSDQ